MTAGRDNPGSVQFDMVDMLERDRSSGALRGLAHYLARFPGHEEEVAREYLRILGLPVPGSGSAAANEPAPPSAGSSRPRDDSETGLLASSGTPLDEQLCRLAAPISRGARFRRDEVLARGGMGVIHRVHDVELTRTLALKEMVLAPAGEHALEAARFLEEAQITAQLDHPGIVPVHEVGMDAEGRLFFAMKLVRGRDLRTILELARSGSEGWTQPRLLGVLLKVCEAMAYAHTKGVIHRDLKPGNVMVGHFGEVYVMDWGLARAMGRQDVHDIRLKPGDGTESLRTERRDEREETPDSPLVTMDGVVVGTPAYMSPEQARGDIHLLSPRSDVYSIGAMLYHLLTGQTPYVSSGVRLSKHTVLARVIEGPPRPMEELVPDVPAELVAICEKAMAREPGGRYADTLALGDDLRAYLEGRVVRAHENGAIPEFRKWIGRNRWLAAACAVAILALAGGFATSSRLYVRASEARVLASAEAAEASRRAEEVLRLSVLQELDDLTAEADELWPIEPESARAFEAWLERARRILATLPEHEAKLAELETSTRDSERWWRNQLVKLVAGLKTLGDPTTGLLAGLSPEHGWGIERRLDFANSVGGRTVSGTDAAARWREATASIRDREQCPVYAGLELVPQLGLLPLGPDPDSGLWEFAHLETGEPARRDPDGRLVLEENTGLVFVLIPGGTFSMGAQSIDPARPNFMAWAAGKEAPIHAVTLAPFFLSKYEMTQAQWSGFAGRNPSENVEVKPTGLLPVEQVDWFTCDRLLRRLGLRLPTEAQWEYAARAETDTTWWTGNERESLVGAANLADRKCLARWFYYFGGTDFDEWLDDGQAWTSLVGSYDANPFGLHDVAGNVSEWCRDPMADYQSGHHDGDGGSKYDADPQDPRTVRGGSWQLHAQVAASAMRIPARADSISWDVGLRPARMIR